MNHQSTTMQSDLKSLKIAFIGGGNMAQALISGLLSKGIKAKQIIISEPNETQRQTLNKQGLTVVDPTKEDLNIIKQCDMVVLAVKPQVMEQVVADIVPMLSNQLVLSIAAGLPITNLSRMLGGYQKIVRAMPNTPAMIQMGATGLYAAEQIDDNCRQMAYELMSASGLVLWVDTEEQLHAVTAVSGSAPAYFFYMLEAMIEGAVELGLDKKQAAALAMQTALGSAQLSIVSDDEPDELRRKVTSPNGTTQAAIEALNINHVADAIKNAMQACYQRSQELSQLD